MLKIKNFHLLTSLSPDFSFLDMKYIIEVRYFTEYRNSLLFDEENKTNLHIVFLLKTKGAHTFHEVSMNFYSVGNFKLYASGGALQLSILEIIDLRDRSWENIRFQVHDVENQDIDFYCNSIEVLGVKESPIIDN
ncbi:hypothetical protein M3592_27185 [Priestia aryabhattai]|uniref:Uncharacterized protein n=1 Tax=Priestia megaterium Q3 TaxID=1452722 RepID=A0A806U450_PRIMG|nr:MULTISPECIES: hypothetical protein [Priestia]AKP76783.1 hypothetical protein AS52_01818 [Priestia megaterium Q3]MCM2979090.1 hypothetical protein [Priestia aryabhattai]MED3923220.1 hypothetical protein [Priestia aryabhattai]MED3955804.1 hypothetical protein [Priestia aryabhattai]MED3988043.1 hypothetical protein [Priestia aryabhattai]